METYIPAALLVFFISGLIILNKEITRRPTFKETDDMYRKTELCEEIHKSVDEKLACLPEIKKTVTQIETKIDIILENGKK